MSLIQIHDLMRNFDGRILPRNVYFRLDKGGRVGLIGKTGRARPPFYRCSWAKKRQNRAQFTWISPQSR